MKVAITVITTESAAYETTLMRADAGLRLTTDASAISTAARKSAKNLTGQPLASSCWTRKARKKKRQEPEITR
jgi:hypothetical protein